MNEISIAITDEKNTYMTPLDHQKAFNAKRYAAV
jgi:hypothetical protein